MKERAPGLREEWRQQAIGDPVKAGAVAVDSTGGVLVFAFETERGRSWAVAEQPTRALELARLIMDKAQKRGWQPAMHPQISEVKLSQEARPIASRAWIFDSCIILTFQMSDGQDHSYLLPASLALIFAHRILRLHESGRFVDLNAAVPPEAPKH